MFSQPEKFGCLQGTSAVSQSYSHLTIERKPARTAQVHSDLNKLSAAEHSSSLLEDCAVSDIVCAIGSKAEIRHCTGCKSFSYCKSLPDIRVALT